MAATTPPIDWTKPLETVEGVPVILDPRMRANPDADGDYFIIREDGKMFDKPYTWAALAIRHDGRHYLRPDGPILIRNREAPNPFKLYAEALGYTYWDGGDAEPADLDKNKPILKRCDGAMGYTSARDWRHTNCAWDIIGYHRLEPKTFTIELTAEEAVALGMIARATGGDPDRTPRGHIDAIYGKLPTAARRIGSPRCMDGAYFGPTTTEFHSRVKELNDA